MKNTFSTNLHWLSSVSSFSTPISLTILLTKAKSNKQTLRIINPNLLYQSKSTGTKTDIRMKETAWLNTNKLLGKNEIAGKTGNTKGARSCLDSFMKISDWKILIFILGSVG